MTDIDIIEAELAAERRHFDRLLGAKMHRPDPAIAACERNIVRLDALLAEARDERGNAERGSRSEWRNG